MASARGNFSGKIGFIAAAAGSAVGLGNIWKFPFEVGENGGAAFLVMYLIFCFILCFPVMVTEIAIGRRTNRNAVGAFHELGYRNWSIIGMLGILCGVIILSYYNVVAGWSFGYFLEMVRGQTGLGENFSEYTSDILGVGTYALIFMGATSLIVSRGISGGIEKAAKILMPTLIIMILCLVAYALTLENAMKGLEFYLVPDFSKITFEVTYSALGQAFFSLSLGMGALITYGSYVGKNDNIITSAALITLTDVGIAFIAGLMMFPFVFSQGISTSGGAGLIFVTLPAVFESIGSPFGFYVGAFFFLLLSFAALTSTVSLLEVPVAYIVDEHKVKRKKAVWVMALIIFTVGIPSLLANGASSFFTQFITYFGASSTTDFMTFVGHVANDSFLPLGGLLISVFAAYVWKRENLSQEIESGHPMYRGSYVEKYINFALSYVCPIILGSIFILTVLNRFFGIVIIPV